jgi:uncharacterized protein (DUF2062 family)
VSQAQTPSSEPSGAREPPRVRLAGAARDRLRAAWERARNERSSPRTIALSVAVGVFSACTPFIGLHMWIALGLATLLRLNRAWAFLGSRATLMPIFAFVTFAEIEVAHRLRAGRWVPLVPSEAVAHGRDLLLDWGIGTVIVGGSLAAAAGVAAYVVASSWPAPAGARPPSSGSPPSAPPGPPR